MNNIFRFLVVVCLSTLVLGAEGQQRLIENGAQELPDRRTAHSKTYKQLDGSYTTMLSTRVLHVRNSAGVFQDVDPSSANGMSLGKAATDETFYGSGDIGAVEQHCTPEGGSATVDYIAVFGDIDDGDAGLCPGHRKQRNGLERHNGQVEQTAGCILSY